MIVSEDTRDQVYDMVLGALILAKHFNKDSDHKNMANALTEDIVRAFKEASNGA